MPVPGHVAGLITADLRVAQSNGAEVASREVQWVSGSGPDCLCILVHVFGRGCIVLGPLVLQVLIAKGGGAISMTWKAGPRVSRSAWVELAASLHVRVMRSVNTHALNGVPNNNINNNNSVAILAQVVASRGQA